MVILERVFEAGGQTIRLELDAPFGDGNGYRCTYRLTGAGLSREFYGVGVDSAQAVLLTLQNAHVDLLSYRLESGLPIRWLGMVDLGLPLAKSVSASDFDPPAH